MNIQSVEGCDKNVDFFEAPHNVPEKYNLQTKHERKQTVLISQSIVN